MNITESEKKFYKVYVIILFLICAFAFSIERYDNYQIDKNSSLQNIPMVVTLKLPPIDKYKDGFLLLKDFNGVERLIKSSDCPDCRNKDRIIVTAHVSDSSYEENIFIVKQILIY